MVPSNFKSAYVTPLLKKADLDLTDLGSYRLISDLSVISKLLERLVAKHLVKYLTDNGLLPDLQSVYGGNHWTGTAVLKVLADILLALDMGDLAVLLLFNTCRRHSTPSIAVHYYKVTSYLRSRRCRPRLVQFVLA